MESVGSTGFFVTAVKREQHTVGPVLVAWFNYCVLSFTREIANLLIAFASHEACKVRYK